MSNCSTAVTYISRLSNIPLNRVIPLMLNESRRKKYNHGSRERVPNGGIMHEGQ